MDTPTTETKQLKADAARYVYELNNQSDVVSYSHYTLRRYREKWGKETFDAEVDRQLQG